MATTELSRSTLLRKDRDELVTIATAMGGKPGSRTRKAQVVDMILKLAGVDENDDRADAEVGSDGESSDSPSNDDGAGDDEDPDGDDDKEGNESNGSDSNDDDADSNDSANQRRRRRRGRDRDRDTDQHDTEPVDVEGFLDLRDDGYGFLRIDGAAPTKRDVYVSVKQVRQNGLRKGDHLVGKARPANRNEKNPALVEVGPINGGDAETARSRDRFDDLTAVVPHERLRIERADDPTSRAIDLLAPMGRGQRVLVKAPPRSGRTEVLISLGKSIAANHPDLTLFVVMIDERPEDVTVVSEALDTAEVMASTFDRPAEEQVMVAEMAIERAKRLVEAGEHVVVIFDGLSRLARAANLSAPSTSRTLASGIDVSAVLAPRRFFGAARCIDDGGSLTLMATVAVDTGSAIDDLVAGELTGKATTEIVLDRTLAAHRIFPALVADRTSSLNEVALVDADELEHRRVLREALPEGTGVAELLDLIDRHASNAELLKTQTT